MVVGKTGIEISAWIDDYILWFYIDEIDWLSIQKLSIGFDHLHVCYRKRLTLITAGVKSCFQNTTSRWLSTRL